MVRKPSHDDAGRPGTGENKERKGLWSPEEDERLFNQITLHGVSTWSSVAQLAGLRRSGKSFRLRWLNYLRPGLKKEPISKREEEVIISLQRSLGNRWSAIAAKMPGRTDNEIKNCWNSRIRKRLNPAAKSGRARAAGNCAEEPVPAAERTEESTDKAGTAAAALAPLPIPARFPVFACQLVDSSAGAALTSTTITKQQNSSSEESEASVGVDGSEDNARCAAAAGDSNMIQGFLAFDELDYPADLLVDVPGVIDAWESELYWVNPMRSVN